MVEVPIGTAVAYAGEVLDNGKVVIIKDNENWLLCNGAPLAKKKYGKLWDHIKTVHGTASEDADPTTDFNLPDYRGLFLRGVASTRIDRDPNYRDAERPSNHMGGNVGNRVGSTQLGATKKPNSAFIVEIERKHTHGDPTYNGQAGPYEVAVVGRGPGGVDFGAQSAQTNAGDGHTHEIKSGGDDETRPINAYVNYIIRAN
jgi:hypothetical protein